MNVHDELGKGFSEVVYGDAMELELKENGVPYKREFKFKIDCKGTNLLHHYFADFVIEDKIILELKAIECLTKSHIKQVLNY